MLNDHYLITEFGTERLKQAQKILGQVKLSSALPEESYNLSKESITLFEEILDLLEYVIVDEWDLENSNLSTNSTFREAAILFIEIIQYLPKQEQNLIHNSLKF